MLVYLATLFLWQQDGSNVVPCVVTTLYIFSGWWHWEVGGLANLCTRSARAHQKNLGMGWELSDVSLGVTRYFGGEVLYSRLYLPGGPSHSDRDIVEVCGESGIPGSSTLDDYAWQSRVFVAIYCNFLLPILDMSIITKNARPVALEGQSVKSKFHLSLMISQIRLTNCRLPAAASEVWRTKFRVQGPQRPLGSDTWISSAFLQAFQV